MTTISRVLVSPVCRVVVVEPLATTSPPEFWASAITVQSPKASFDTVTDISSVVTLKLFPFGPVPESTYAAGSISTPGTIVFKTSLLSEDEMTIFNSQLFFLFDGVVPVF